MTGKAEVDCQLSISGDVTSVRFSFAFLPMMSEIRILRQSAVIIVHDAETCFLESYGLAALSSGSGSWSSWPSAEKLTKA